MALIFEAIRGGGDNLAYIVGCSIERVVAVVDPIGAHTILEFCAQKKLQILYVLNTHGHSDHTDGNEAVVNAAGAAVLAHPADRIANLDRPLADGDIIPVGRFELRALHTPGHTMGSLCFRINNKIISGDTLFLAGAGNTRFGGSVDELFSSYERKLRTLPDRVEVFPGHDYAENNLRFARTLEPDNPFIDQKLRETRDALRANTVARSTIGEERRYNPFFRCHEPELIESLRAEFPDLAPDQPHEVFRLVRELRNSW